MQRSAIRAGLVAGGLLLAAWFTDLRLKLKGQTFFKTGNRGLVGLMNFLMWFGNTTIMLMAAIMGVDPTLYEACLLYTSRCV